MIVSLETAKHLIEIQLHHDRGNPQYAYSRDSQSRGASESSRYFQGICEVKTIFLTIQNYYLL